MRGLLAPAPLALAALAALHAGDALGDEAARAQPGTPSATPTPAAVSVTLHSVSAQRIERTVDFVGTLNAYAEAEVAAEVDGRLTSIAADLGDQVAKGQVLATLDAAELEAKLREAEATLARSDNDERRAQRLRAQGVMSQQEFDAISSTQNVARARRDVLAIQVEHTRITAPFDGRIAKRLADVGNYVRTGKPLFVLVADNPLRLRGEVPERFAAEIHTGQEVRGYVEAFPDGTIEGRLTRISPAANPQSRALAVEALVPNGDGQLKTGFFCKAQILTRTDAQALVVPAEALVSFAGVTRVFVIDDQGVAHGRQIQTGLRLGTLVEVTQGIAAGERVATSGLGRLAEGTQVSVREAPPAAAHPAGVDQEGDAGRAGSDREPAGPQSAGGADRAGFRVPGALDGRLGARS